MIKLTNIVKTYYGNGVSTVALNSLSLTVEQGDFVALMGPSGCGKTSLLNIIGMLDNVTDGSYLLNGNDVSSAKESQRDLLRKGNIGFIFQSFNLIDEISVVENVELPLKYLGYSRSERRKMALSALHDMKIDHRASYYPFQLSGGQQQLTAIARAIVCKPNIILADEPTGNIDSKTGQYIMEVLSQINAKTHATIIMATHNNRDAAFAKRVVNMLDGTIITATDNYINS